MRKFGKTEKKPNYLFGKLPWYFKHHDSYKDILGEGLLERYLEIFCQEIDEELSPYIEDVLDINDAEKLPWLVREDGTELLNNIALLFGNPPDVGIDFSYSGGEQEYIKLIRYIKYILQNKGTTKALGYYLAIYGYKIDSLDESDTTLNHYDGILEYDTGLLYDMGFIFYSDWDLVITDLPGTMVKNPPQHWLDNYVKPSIQNFISPIWATLKQISYT